MHTDLDNDLGSCRLCNLRLTAQVQPGVGDVRCVNVDDGQSDQRHRVTVDAGVLGSLRHDRRHLATPAAAAAVASPRSQEVAIEVTGYVKKLLQYRQDVYISISHSKLVGAPIPFPYSFSFFVLILFNAMNVFFSYRLTRVVLIKGS